jgi:RNA polymerase sigma factor (sigma-70 family)
MKSAISKQEPPIENIKYLNVEYNYLKPKIQIATQKTVLSHYEQESIITLLKKQDTVAIEQLYDIYGAALYGAALRIVCSKELAEQVLQDTFLKVWHYGVQYDESKGRLFTWLLKITRNTAIDATRNSHFHNSKKTDFIDSLNESSGGDCINPDTLGLREIVDKMEYKYRVIIDLVYFNQYTHQEAADVTGLPIGTVKTRVRFAITELKKVFKF